MLNVLRFPDPDISVGGILQDHSHISQIAPLLERIDVQEIAVRLAPLCNAFRVSLDPSRVPSFRQAEGRPLDVKSLPGSS